MRFVHYVQRFLLIRDLCVTLWSRISKRAEDVDEVVLTTSSARSQEPIQMNMKDCFYERLIIREYFLSKPRDEAIALLAPFIVTALNRTRGRQQADIMRLSEQIQQDLNDRLLGRGIYQMSKKREFFKEWTFARIELSVEQKEACKAFISDGATDPMELLIVAMEEGYKFSAKYQPDRGSWIATLSGTEITPHNANCSLSAFHGTLDAAIGVLMYKHVVLAGQKDWPTLTPSSDWG